MGYNTNLILLDYTHDMVYQGICIHIGCGYAV